MTYAHQPALDDDPVFADHHATALLTLLTSLDGRWRAPDADTAAIRARAWAMALDDAMVDPQWAMTYAARCYASPRETMLDLGEIVGEWRHLQAVERARDEEAFERQVNRDHPRIPAGVFWTYLRDVLAAIQRGDEVSSVPRPTGSRGLHPKVDERMRRCVYHTLCGCPHTLCRDGWLDAPAELIGATGRPYEAVKRCPDCLLALELAQDRGIAKRPSRATQQRRR